MEDLKSAEQLVKKKQQLENQQRTSELQQLVASQHSTTTSSYRVPSTSGKLFYLTLGIFNNETFTFILLSEPCVHITRVPINLVF